jgi:hypothetical protein
MIAQNRNYNSRARQFRCNCFELGKNTRLDKRAFAAGLCLADDELRRLVIVNLIVSAPCEEVYFEITPSKARSIAVANVSSCIVMLKRLITRSANSEAYDPRP